MPTLVNYNQSTFKNHAKPNKRRLQELQHSEARAHAARVAYWRKKGVHTSEPQQSQQSQRSSSHDENHSTGPSKSPPHVKEESDKSDTALVQSASRVIGESGVAVDIPVVKDVERRPGHAYKTSTQSGSILSTSHPTSTPTGDRWRLGSETASSFDDIYAEHWEKPAEVVTMPRPPTSHLFDPFDSLPARQGDEVVAAMDHYIHNWAPSQRPGLKYQTKDNPLIRDTFPSALQNVELFEASVALCLSFKAAGQNFQTRMCNWSLYHKGQALNGIRTKLNSGWVDEAVILATVFLMIIDNVFLDVHAYEAHLRGLRKMVKASSACTMEMFGGSLSSFVSWAEANALLIFGNRIAEHDPDFDHTKLQYPHDPFPPSVTRMVAALTSGFQFVAMDGQLSLDVLSILAKTIRWTGCIDRASEQSPKEDDRTFLMGFDPRANSAQIMKLCRVSGEEHRVERAICKALFIYHANLLGWTCRCSGYRRIVEELGSTLRFWELQKHYDMDIWKWLALLTANAARRGKLHYLEMEVMAKFMSLEDPTHGWDYIRGELKKFLLHSKLEHEWKQCWETARISAGV